MSFVKQHTSNIFNVGNKPSLHFTDMTITADINKELNTINLNKIIDGRSSESPLAYNLSLTLPIQQLVPFIIGCTQSSIKRDSPASDIIYNYDNDYRIFIKDIFKGQDISTSELNSILDDCLQHVYKVYNHTGYVLENEYETRLGGIESKLHKAFYLMKDTGISYNGENTNVLNKMQELFNKIPESTKKGLSFIELLDTMIEVSRSMQGGSR